MNIRTKVRQDADLQAVSLSRLRGGQRACIGLKSLSVLKNDTEHPVLNFILFWLKGNYHFDWRVTAILIEV